MKAVAIDKTIAELEPGEGFTFNHISEDGAHNEVSFFINAIPDYSWLVRAEQHVVNTMRKFAYYHPDKRTGVLVLLPCKGQTAQIITAWHPQKSPLFYQSLYIEHISAKSVESNFKEIYKKSLYPYTVELSLDKETRLLYAMQGKQPLHKDMPPGRRYCPVLYDAVLQMLSDATLPIASFASASVYRYLGDWTFGVDVSIYSFDSLELESNAVPLLQPPAWLQGASALEQMGRLNPELRITTETWRLE